MVAGAATNPKSVSDVSGLIAAAADKTVDEIDLAAGTYVLPGPLVIGHSVAIVGAPGTIITNGATWTMPSPAIVPAAVAKYLVSIGNDGSAGASATTTGDLTVDFSGISFVVAATTATGSGAAGLPSYGLGAVNYYSVDSSYGSGKVSGTITDCSMSGGFVGLNINGQKNLKASTDGGSCVVTVDSLMVSGTTTALGKAPWGGVGVSDNATLVLTGEGLLNDTSSPIPVPIYGDTANAWVKMPEGTLVSLGEDSLWRVYTYDFDLRGGSWGGTDSAVSGVLMADGTVQLCEYSDREVTTPDVADLVPPAPDASAPAGYVFSGWYTDEDLTEELDISVYPTENVTIYAAWTPAEEASTDITVTTDVEGKEAQHTLPEGSKVSDLGTAEKNGYDFKGWALTADGQPLGLNVILEDGQIYYAIFAAQSVKPVPLPDRAKVTPDTFDSTTLPIATILGLLMAGTAAVALRRRSALMLGSE